MAYRNQRQNQTYERPLSQLFGCLAVRLRKFIDAFHRTTEHVFDFLAPPATSQCLDLRGGLLRAQGLDTDKDTNDFKAAWQYYNERWSNAQQYIRQQFAKQIDHHGTPYFKVYQPAFLHMVIPWPVASTKFCDVDEDTVRQFYLRTILGTRHSMPLDGDHDSITKYDVMYAEHLINQERGRWWPFVTYVDDHLHGSEAEVGRGHEARKKLLVVLKVLEELRRRAEEPILELQIGIEPACGSVGRMDSCVLCGMGSGVSGE